MLDTVKAAAGRVGIVTGSLGGLLMVGLLLAGPSNAQTAPADPALEGINDLGTKIGVYGAAIVALVVLSIGIMLGIKYLRKAQAKG